MADVANTHAVAFPSWLQILVTPLPVSTSTCLDDIGIDCSICGSPMT